MLWRTISKNSENTSALRAWRTLPVASIAAILYWRSFFLHWKSIDWEIYINAKLNLHRITESLHLHVFTHLLSRWLWWILGFNDWGTTWFTESADSFQDRFLHEDNEMRIMLIPCTITCAIMVIATAKYHTKSLLYLPFPPKFFLVVQPTNCS